MITDRLMKCDNRNSSHLLPIASGKRNRQTGGREWESEEDADVQVLSNKMNFKGESTRSWIILVIIMYDFRRNEVFLSASAHPI